KAYVGIGPLEMFVLRKSILPSMPFSLTDLAIDIGAVERSYSGSGVVPHPEYDKQLVLLNGEQVAQYEARVFEKFNMQACVGYVVEAKEFTVKKDATKRGLLLVIDTDNYLREMVMWPDYDTGKLVYPDGLAKGAVAIFYVAKRKGKADASVSAVTLL